MEESDEALARYGEGTGGFKRFAVCDCDLDDYAEEGRFYIYNNVFLFYLFIHRAVRCFKIKRKNTKSLARLGFERGSRGNECMSLTAALG